MDIYASLRNVDDHRDSTSKEFIDYSAVNHNTSFNATMAQVEHKPHLAFTGKQVRYLMRGINCEKLGLKYLNVGKISWYQV